MSEPSRPYLQNYQVQYIVRDLEMANAVDRNEMVHHITRRLFDAVSPHCANCTKASRVIDEDMLRMQHRVFLTCKYDRPCELANPTKQYTYVMPPTLMTSDPYADTAMVDPLSPEDRARMEREHAETQRIVEAAALDREIKDLEKLEVINRLGDFS